MNIRELRESLDKAIADGYPEDAEVRLHNPDSPCMAAVLAPLQHCEFRKHQVWTSETESRRTKILVLSPIINGVYGKATQ